MTPVADDPIKVVLTHPEMSRADKIYVLTSYAALLAYVLLGLRPRKRRG